MESDKRAELYSKIYNNFIDLVNGKIEKVIIEPKEIYELDYILPSKEAIINENYDCTGFIITGRYNNMADILREHFGDKLVQEIDVATGNYIFRKQGENKL